MKDYADLLLRSMAARDPWSLPLAARYAATENSVAGSLNMMSFWRTVTGIRHPGQRFADPVAGQLVFTAALDEGGSATVVWGRLKIEDDKIAELELYNVRSRAEAGFVMLADEMGTLPHGWTSAIPAGGRATREELFELGRAIFDDSLPAPDASPDCILMEAGGVVLEDPEYLDVLFGGEAAPHRPGESVSIPAGIGPGRPSDKAARVVLVDEEQGVVAAIGVLPGFVSPYVMSSATESCFVPAAMIEMHHRTLLDERFKGRSVVREMPAVAVTMELVRLHSGKLRGLQLLSNIQGPGGGTPWVGRH